MFFCCFGNENNAVKKIFKLKMSGTSEYLIDALTSIVQRFGVTQNEKYLDCELDYIVNKMASVKIEVNDNWQTLQSNYSKLQYLYELICFYNTPTDGKFIKTVEIFIISLDKQNQFYLDKIELEAHESEFKIEGKLVKRCLKKSLKQRDPIAKLSSVLKAYQILTCVVEDIRGEKYEYFVESAFIEQFEQPTKRRKTLRF